MSLEGADAPLEVALTDYVKKLLSSEESPCLDDQSLSSVRLTVLSRIARFLQIPFDPAEMADRSDDRVVLSHRTLARLDEAWHRVTGPFSDHHVTPQERLVRQQVFLHAPFYVEKKALSKFVSILSKKDVCHGFYAATVARGSATKRHAPVLVAKTRGGRGKGGDDNDDDDDDDDGTAVPSDRSAGVWEPLGNAVPHLKSNALNGVLAVDGFRGLSPSSYKYYVPHLNDRLPAVEKKHLAAVRNLYSREPLGASAEGKYSGTFCASCVFLTLVRLYSRAVGPRMEDFVRSAAAKAIEDTTRFVEDNDEGGDFCSNGRFDRLAGIYLEKLNDNHNDKKRVDGYVLECLAIEKLKGLATKCARPK